MNQLSFFDEFDDDEQRKKKRDRDEALDALQATRGELIAVAKNLAILIAKRYGSVTSVQVMDRLRRDPVYAAKLEKVDPRWIGVVFREGWHRVGYTNTGSHARPVSIWEYTG